MVVEALDQLGTEVSHEIRPVEHADQPVAVEVALEAEELVDHQFIADLDELAGFLAIAEEEAKNEDVETRRVHHRQRLAELGPPPKRLRMREERAALRALLDLPPSERA